MARYEEAMAPGWVETRGEGGAREVRLKTLDEIRGLLERPGFILIPGEEITDAFDNRPIHTNAMNLARMIPPPHGDSLRETMRNAVLAAEAQGRELGRPVLPHLNHPNFHYAVTAEDIAHVVEEGFFEVYNGHPGVGHTGDESHPSVERLWDIASTLRIAELKAPPPYGVATDDAHHYFPGQPVTPGRGWVMVRAEGLDAASLISAMRRGDFYASSGVALTEVRYDGRKLTVEVDPVPGHAYTIEFIGTLEGYDASVTPRTDEKGNAVTGQYSNDVGQVLESAQGTKAAYTLKGRELYVRAVVHDDHPPENPAFQGQHAQAWTQPVGWEKRIDPHVTAKHFHRDD